MSIAHLAAALTPEGTHGLATLDLFQDSAEMPSLEPVRYGHLRIPDDPGIGVNINENQSG